MKFIYIFLLFSFYFVNAQVVNIPNANLKARLLEANESNTIAKNLDGNFFKIDQNDDNEIQVSEAEFVSELSLGSLGNVDSFVGLESFVNNVSLEISPFNSPDGNFTLQNLTNVEILRISNFDVSNINLIGINSLKTLDVSGNQNENFNSINLDSCNCFDLENIFLTELFYLSDIDISPFINLKNFQVYVNFGITELDISNNINLEVFSLYVTEISQLDFSLHPNLLELYVYEQNLSYLDISNSLNLNRLDLNYSGNFESLDLSNHSNLSILDIYEGNISSINMKNGHIIDNFNIYGNNVNYICADEDEIELLQGMHLPNAVLNTYCSFNPGGDYFSIEGQNKVDADQNGCEINDYLYPNLKFNITDGTNNGMFFCDNTGSYSIPFIQGDHIITPIIENPDYFLDQEPITVNFPQESSPFNLDFCIIPNGTNNDLQIYIIPVGEAIPGFDSEYKIIYKNVGNTLLSGNIEFDYSLDSNYIQNSSSVPSANSNVNNILSWDYEDLAPFETREILVSFLLNTPTDLDFPLNIGHELNFNTIINPLSEDETIDNNSFDLNQIVVNSFDPNDIRCIEGEFILPEKVGEYVNYLIRFENIGTANATNVVVKNPIDTSKFDINTLIPLNGSHDFFTRINEANEVEFIFENINLSFNADENNGYVFYKIKTLQSLILGDEFSNQAEIYFDFNAPIITNSYSTIIAEDNLSVTDFNSLDTKLFPNPVIDILNIKGNGIIDNVSIYSLKGELVFYEKFIEQTNQKELNISLLSSGIYFIKTVSAKGINTKKIVKK